MAMPRRRPFRPGRPGRALASARLALLAAGAAALGVAGLAVTCPGAPGASASVAGEASVRPTLPPASTLSAEAKADSKNIAAKLGHGLSLHLSVAVNTTQMYGKVPAYAFAYDSSGGETGTPASCVVSVNPSFADEDADYQKLALIHEVFHCYEAMDFPTLSAFYAAPAWLIEGEAEWVGATLAPTTLPVWDAYLTDLHTSLFARSYDAIGFYAHMTNSGEDTWHLLDGMLKAGSSAAAYNVAANKEVRLTWASSFARQSGLGKGWATTGPGITSATYHPGIYDVAVGSTFNSSVVPYTNALVRFQVSGAQVVDISAPTPYSRLHTADGKEYDDLASGPNAFCVSNCTMCQQLKDLPRLTSGVNWLAVTGDAGGSSWSIAGAKATCQPCLVGNWVVTNLTLTTSPGGSHSGAAGSTVDIMDNGDVTADFTPGSPLSNGVKFSGTQTDHYNFAPHTTARSGSILDTPGAYASTITVGGVTEAIKPESAFGSYQCVGTGLSLDFTKGPSQLSYTLVPAG
jgi:hypothetical protein